MPAPPLSILSSYITEFRSDHDVSLSSSSPPLSLIPYQSSKIAPSFLGSYPPPPVFSGKQADPASVYREIGRNLQTCQEQDCGSLSAD